MSDVTRLSSRSLPFAAFWLAFLFLAEVGAADAYGPPLLLRCDDFCPAWAAEPSPAPAFYCCLVAATPLLASASPRVALVALGTDGLFDLSAAQLFAAVTFVKDFPWVFWDLAKAVVAAFYFEVTDWSSLAEAAFTGLRDLLGELVISLSAAAGAVPWRALERDVGG